MSIQRFAVEFDRRTVGVAVGVPGGFMFFSSDERFDELDGQSFRRARAIGRRLEQVSKKWERRGLASRPAFAATA